MRDRYEARSTDIGILRIVLDEANEIRKALAIGDGTLPSLPPGKQGDSESCVLARALSNGWSAFVEENTTGIRHPAEGKSAEDIIRSCDALEELGFEATWEEGYFTGGWTIAINNTWAMERFIRLFDNGAFPDLILKDD